MIINDIDISGLDEQVESGWNEFWVGVFYQSRNGYNTSKDSEKYFKKGLELIDKGIDVDVIPRNGMGFFGYRVDYGMPMEDYIGILDVGTEVVITAEGKSYKGIVIGDRGEDGMTDEERQDYWG